MLFVKNIWSFPVKDVKWRCTFMKQIFSFALVVVLCVCCCFNAGAENDAWICTECSAENTTNFCTKCGMKKPETIICPGCGEKYPIDTNAVFCGNCGTKLQQDVIPSVRLEGNGFASPEAAVTFFLEGLKNLDFEQMLRAFAWETQAEHFSVEVKIRRARAYGSIIQPRLLGDSSFIRAANMYSLRAIQIDAIYQALESYILRENHPSNVSANGSIIFREDAELNDFISKFDNGRLETLKDLKNIRFLTPDQVTNGNFSSERNTKNYLEMNAVYCADETVDVPAVADVDDGILFFCPTVARYGDKWYLVSVSSMTALFIGLNVSRQAFAYVQGDINDLLP